MLNIVISLAVSLAAGAVLYQAAGLQPWICTLVAMVVFAACYFLIMRAVMKKIEVLAQEAQKDLQAGRTEKALNTLKKGFKYAPWQVFIKSQINAQIGTVLFLTRDFAKAFDYLKEGNARHWVGMGMLAICYMKRNKTGKMIETFDKAVTATRKESLLWCLYAYCLDKVGEREKAIAILEKGAKKVPGSEPLEANLKALQEGRKMRMMVYGDMWYQFHLEKPGNIMRQQTKAIQGRRKIVRR